MAQFNSQVQTQNLKTNKSLIEVLSRAPKIVLVPGQTLFYWKVPSDFLQHLGLHEINKFVLCFEIYLCTKLSYCIRL